MQVQIFEGPHMATLDANSVVVYPNKPADSFVWLRLNLSAPSWGRQKLVYKVHKPDAGAVSSFCLYSNDKARTVSICVFDDGALGKKAKELLLPTPRPFTLPFSIAVAAVPEERLEFTAAWTKADGWRITHQPIRAPDYAPAGMGYVPEFRTWSDSPQKISSSDPYHVMAANALNQQMRERAASEARWFVAFSDGWDAAAKAQFLGTVQKDFGVDMWLEELRKARILGTNKCRDMCVNSVLVQP